jgi:hypothetical protein
MGAPRRLSMIVRKMAGRGPESLRVNPNHGRGPTYKNLNPIRGEGRESEAKNICFVSNSRPSTWKVIALRGGHQVLLRSLRYYIARNFLTYTGHLMLLKVRVKLSLYLTKHHANETYWGSGGIAQRILWLATRWRWVVSFTPLPLYTQGKSPWYPLDRRLSGPRAGLDEVSKRKIPGIEPRSYARPTRSQSLYRLSYAGSPLVAVAIIKSRTLWWARHVDHMRGKKNVDWGNLLESWNLEDGRSPFHYQQNNYRTEDRIQWPALVLAVLWWVGHYHEFAHPQVANGRDGLQIWRLAACECTESVKAPVLHLDIS